jgi:membrane protease YdiL (CAAX protease family)
MPPEEERDHPVNEKEPPRGHPWLAWLIILAVVLFIVVRGHLRRPEARGDERHAALLIQGRNLVGLAHLGLPGWTPDMVYRQARDLLDRGSFGQRLCFVTLAGELAGPREARRQLRRLDAERSEGKLEASAAAARTAAILGRLYAGHSLSEDKQDLLRRRLGWFGELALAAPDGPDQQARPRVLAAARRTALVHIGQAAGLILGAVLGGGLLLVLFVLGVAGRLGGGLARSGHGGVYAETFALYLLLTLGLGYGARLVPAGKGGLLLQGAVMLAGLAALAWPVLRGVPWAQVRADVGWPMGERPLREALLGPVCYLATLPLLAGGLIVMLLLVFAQRRLGWGDPLGGDNAPSHPIIGLALSAGPWVWVQLFLLAAVLAPIVEETMFRGVLYRHLREAIPGRALSIVAAVLLSSFVFAVIHPQGFLAVPVLMALAVGFALAREWRQTLLPCMIAHGINNALVSLLLLLATR